MNLNRIFLVIPISLLSMHSAYATKTRTMASLLAINALRADSGSAFIPAPVMECIDYRENGYDGVPNETTVFNACKLVVNACHGRGLSEEHALKNLAHVLSVTKDVDERDERDRSGLCIMGGYLDKIGSNQCDGVASAVDMLLGAGANAKAVRFNIFYNQDYWSFNMLTASVRYGHPSLLSMLVSAGLDINEGEGEWGRGLKPLHFAVNENIWCEPRYNRNVSALTLMLLELGADPGVHADFSDLFVTPLHLADTNQTVQFLLEYGADKDARTLLRGDTPLIWATLLSADESVATLLQAGADATLRRRGDNKTALEIAHDVLERNPDNKRALVVVQLLNGTLSETPLPKESCSLPTSSPTSVPTSSSAYGVDVAWQIPILVTSLAAMVK